MSEEDDIMAAWGAALSEQAEAEKKAAEEPPADSSEQEDRSHLLNTNGADVETVPLENFGESAPISKEEKRRLDSILDIPVVISMEVGRSQITIRNLLQLNQGSVVELERVAGEPLDVNDKFGIRLTDVISQTERIKKLK